MKSTMQDTPLSIGQLVRFGTSIHSSAEITTWTDTGPTTVTFGELGRRAAQLAHGLRSIGIDDDQRVATFMWNNAPHMEAYMAIPAMGAVLHTLNIRLFPEQLTYIVNHAEDQVIIADASLLPLLTPLLPTFETVRHLIVVGVDPAQVNAPESIEVLSYEDLLSGKSEEFDWPELDERSAAAMCYTSGTTSDPKGVVYSHRSIYLHSMQACMTDAMAIAQSDKVLAIVPMFHAMSWGLPYAALMVGASLIMPDRFLQPAPLAEMMSTLRPTAAAAVPTIWQALLEHLEDHPADLSSLRDVVVGGSACPPSLMRAFHEKYGVHISQAWGMTETSPLGTSGDSPTPGCRRRTSSICVARRADSSPGCGHDSSTMQARCCRGTVRPSANSRCVARGSPAATTARTQTTNSTTAGCAPATSAPSPRAATSG